MTTRTHTFILNKKNRCATRDNHININNQVIQKRTLNILTNRVIIPVFFASHSSHMLPFSFYLFTYDVSIVYKQNHVQFSLLPFIFVCVRMSSQVFVLVNFCYQQKKTANVTVHREQILCL